MMNLARHTVNINTRNGGFTLLYAVLFVSVFLAISLGISGLIMGQIQLSGSGRESQKAFYAADAGLWCAVRWDHRVVMAVRSTLFSTSSPPSTIDCGGSSNAVTFDSSTNQFVFNITLTNNSCVNVTVFKPNEEDATITSLGRSPCAGRRSERGLELSY